MDRLFSFKKIKENDGNVKKNSHVICALVVGKIYKYEFRLYLQNLSGICKMGITFAYELGLKSFYMKNHLLEKLREPR